MLKLVLAVCVIWFYSLTNLYFEGIKLNGSQITRNNSNLNKIKNNQKEIYLQFLKPNKKLLSST
jgi:lipid-binding SYLF domain-containing protein